VNRYKLANGITVIEDPIEGSQSFTLMVMFKTGSRNETPEIWGISHFLEHMAFKGTKSYPSAAILADELVGLGVRYNAFTSKEYTGYYIKGAKKVFEKSLSIISEMTTSPVILDEEVDKERGTIIEEINMVEDSPQEKIYEYFEECLYSNKQVSQNVIGTKSSLSGIHSKEIKEYREKYYRTGNAVVSISGCIPESFKELLERKFSEFKDGKNDYLQEIVEKKKQINLLNKDTQQTHLAIGFPALRFTDDEKDIAFVLGVVLGGNMSSRMFTEIREKRGLAYYINTFHEGMADTGMVTTFAGVNNEKAIEAVGIINEVYKSVLTELPEEELIKTKNYIIGNMALQYEESERRSTYNAICEIYGAKLETLEEKIARVESITAEQVVALANRLFDDKKLCLALIGPFKDEEKFTKILKLK
jgi:predicted Zn-dependent peptidase